MDGVKKTESMVGPIWTDWNLFIGPVWVRVSPEMVQSVVFTRENDSESGEGRSVL